MNEPSLSKSPGRVGTTEAMRNGRWRWYYASIADYRLGHPGCTNKEVALFIRKHENTVGAIVASDIYQEYEAQRREKMRAENDEIMRQKLTGAAILALDSITLQFEKKKDQVPLQIAVEVAKSTLDRLGFAPQAAPQVVVNNNQQVLIPNAVSPAALEEARMALRAVEARRIGEHVRVEPAQSATEAPVLEVELEEGSHDSATDS